MGQNSDEHRPSYVANRRGFWKVGEVADWQSEAKGGNCFKKVGWLREVRESGFCEMVRVQRVGLQFVPDHGKCMNTGTEC